MKMQTLCGRVNSIVLFLIIVLNTLNQSELGGPGAIWNTLVLLLVIVVILLNFPKIDPLILVAVSFPILFIALSVLVNSSSLHPGGFRSALATAIGYLLFALVGVGLSKKLLLRFVAAYLTVCLAISAYIFFENREFVLLPNFNFNVNPNSAAQFFFFCVVLSLVFLQSKVKWMFVAAYSFLAITTQSRGGVIAIAVALCGFWFFSSPVRHFDALKNWVNLWQPITLLAITSGLALTLSPENVFVLLERLGSLFERFDVSRGNIWKEAVDASLTSTTTILFGHGPATLGGIISRGAHNSYLEAVGSVGYPFLIASIFAILTWMFAVLRKGDRTIIWVSLSILTYGLSETFLFSGTGMLWFCLMFVGLYLQGKDADFIGAPQNRDRT